LISAPSTCSVTVDAPGIGLLKNSHAAVASAVGAMVAGITVPVVSVAKKLMLVSVDTSTGRENVTFGR
jgi:hypothetical protein